MAETHAPPADPAQRLLILNAGSSSLKFALYGGLAEGGDPAPILRGEVRGIGRAGRFVVHSAPAPRGLDIATDFPDHGAAIAHVLRWLGENGHDPDRLAGAGHRVVHGGGVFNEPVLIGTAVLERLDGFCALAPHHQPHNVAAIRALREVAPHLPQVACFDTAFHATIPDIATVLPLPRKFRERGVRRYGFHGLSYAGLVGRLPDIAAAPLPKRLLACHLGNGASLCAIREGASIATTMGFSTLDGLIMATRSGALDPGVILHLLQAEKMKADELEKLLYDHSGLLALSGTSPDMRQLLAADGHEARFAVEVFCHAVQLHAGAMIAAMEGVDAIAFTGGIGENAAPVRARIMDRLAWTGLVADHDANRRGGPKISAPRSGVSAWIVAADEEAVIAAQTARLIAG